MKYLRLFLIAALTMVVASCSDIYNRQAYVVYNGYGEEVEYYDANRNLLGKLPSRTEVGKSAYGVEPDGYREVVLYASGSHVYIKDSYLNEIIYEVEKVGENEFVRLPSTVEKLDAAGSHLAAEVMDAIDILHLYKKNFSTGTWTLILIVTVLLSCLFIMCRNKLCLFISIICVVAAYSALFVIFCIQEPFVDSYHTPYGWFVDLLAFIGILLSVIYLYSAFTPAMTVLTPSSSIAELPVAGFNAVIQILFLLLFCCMLAFCKGHADWPLWCMAAIQVIFSLYVLVTGFMTRNFIGSILYLILFPFIFISLVISIVTMGLILGIIVMLIWSVMSAITAPAVRKYTYDVYLDGHYLGQVDY